MTTAEDVERLKVQVRDLERILVREGAVEASYERQLAEAVRERDEARAEVERLRKAKHTNGCRQQSAYNAECVCGADEAQRDLLRTVAERQREACAAVAEREAYGMTKTAGQPRIVGVLVRATPLVTEGET